MNTRSLAARLKRRDFRLRPGFVRLQIVISIINSKGQALYNLRLLPTENQCFSLDDKRITKEEADQLSAPSERSNQP